jgi:uncharacterized membrane protein
MHRNGKVPTAPRLARALGWFSIGLGLAEFLAPKRMGKLTGIGEHPFLLRLFGMREMAIGLGILTQHRPAGWVWSRVGGDVMDLAVLGVSLKGAEARPGRIAAATAAVAGVTALDVLCGQELSRAPGPRAASGAIHVETSLVVNRAPDELYRFWRDFENLPKFMDHLESVRVTGDKTSHWKAKGPAGTSVEWEAEIINETPGELIAWRSVEPADVEHAGAVRFERAPGGRGTIVRVKLQYRPIAGRWGAMAAKLLGQAPEQQIRTDLRRFKQLIETGEIARTEGQPAGRAKSTSRKSDELVRH